MMTIQDIMETPVVLADYSRIEIPGIPVVVTEEEIAQSIEKAREQMVERIEFHGPAQQGHEVRIDFSGQAGPMSFPPTPVENYAVVIGSGGFYEEIENRLIGTKAGDVVNVTIDMPPNMLPPACGTNQLTVTIKVKQIFEHQLPALDDQFVAKISDCGTVEEFKAYVREQCRRQKENGKIPMKQNKALSYMISHSVAEIRQEFVEEKAKELMDSFAEQLKEANCTFEQYLEHAGMTAEAYRERALLDAKKLLSGSCILYKIAEKEHLEASEDAVNASIKQLDYTGLVTVKELRERLSEDDMERIVFTVKLQEASLLLLSRVVEV